MRSWVHKVASRRHRRRDFVYPLILYAITLIAATLLYLIF